LPPTIQGRTPPTVPTSCSSGCDSVTLNPGSPPYSGKRTIILEEFAEEEYNGIVTPDLIRRAYSVPSELNSNGELAKQSVFATVEQSFSPSDLESWQNMFELHKKPVWSTVGPNNYKACKNDINYCMEGNPDTQYISSIATNAQTWFWSVPYNPFYSPFLGFVEQLDAEPNPPEVNSISYANGEGLVHPDILEIFNTEACKLGLRGITIIVASGDFGAPGLEGCDLDPENPRDCTINSMFPASSPYVTTVGATMGPEFGKKEVAASNYKGDSLFTSGGGFSIYYRRPDYQSKAVKKYLQTSNSVDPRLFDSYGRGYPDVSFLGKNFEVVINGTEYLFSGTSISTPTFASVITLANSLRIADGKPKLGFLNPLLYSKKMAGVYNDITTGHNKCCVSDIPNVEGKCCPNGFEAASGWDPITGLGSIDIGEFLKVVMDLPPKSEDIDM
jgi:tripeptidyl-peptidase-1